jgi:lycopene cyclase domain-containing protein
MKYTYLIIDFFTVLVPLLFSFHPKNRFIANWKAIFTSILLIALPFVVWDAWFTEIGVWGFNDNYLIGLRFFDLPIEEILFFICIPYACLFTFHTITPLVKPPTKAKLVNIISFVLALLFSIISIMNTQHWYTALTFGFLAATIILVRAFVNPKWMGKFYLSYLILLVPFFVVNGILTGTGLESPVVWYNPDEIIGFRLLTIPIEDIFYGMLLILLNVIVYESLKSKWASQVVSSR